MLQDYTNRPAVNKQPGTSNNVFLAELYGTVPGSAPYIPETDDGVDVEEQAQVDESAPENFAPETLAPSKPGKHEDRMLRGHTISSERMLRFVDQVDQEINQGISALGAHNGWRLLHRSDYGEAHEKKLDDRYKVQVHFLLA